jgi:hypothetical protein
LDLTILVHLDITLCPSLLGVANHDCDARVSGLINTPRKRIGTHGNENLHVGFQQVIPGDGSWL